MSWYRASELGMLVEMQDLIYMLLNIDVKLSASSCSSVHFKSDEMGQGKHPTPLSHVGIGYVHLKKFFLVYIHD